MTFCKIFSFPSLDWGWIHVKPHAITKCNENVDHESWEIWFFGMQFGWLFESLFQSAGTMPGNFQHDTSTGILMKFWQFEQFWKICKFHSFQSITEVNFRYSGARLCTHLDLITSTPEKSTSVFRTTLIEQWVIPCKFKNKLWVKLCSLTQKLSVKSSVLKQFVLKN